MTNFGSETLQRNLERAEFDAHIDKIAARFRNGAIPKRILEDMISDGVDEKDARRIIKLAWARYNPSIKADNNRWFQAGKWSCIVGFGIYVICMLQHIANILLSNYTRVPSVFHTENGLIPLDRVAYFFAALFLLIGGVSILLSFLEEYPPEPSFPENPNQDEKEQDK